MHKAKVDLAFHELLYIATNLGELKKSNDLRMKQICAYRAITGNIHVLSLLVTSSATISFANEM